MLCQPLSTCFYAPGPVVRRKASGGRVGAGRQHPEPISRSAATSTSTDLLFPALPLCVCLDRAEDQELARKPREGLSPSCFPQHNI